MSKSAKGAAAAKLVQDATSASGLFVFAELLDVPNIQEVRVVSSFGRFIVLTACLAREQRNARFVLRASPALRLQDLPRLPPYASLTPPPSLTTPYESPLHFYTTEHKDTLPPLSPTQITKLRHLSLVTFSMQRRILSYSDLLSALGISNIRELEDLIIDAIYLDILRGKLDQKEQQFEVEYTMGRDLEPESLGNLLGALQDWCVATHRNVQLTRSTSSLLFIILYCIQVRNDVLRPLSPRRLSHPPLLPVHPTRQRLRRTRTALQPTHERRPGQD